MLNVAVIGTGFIGSAHAKNFARHPNAKLVAVSDVNIESANRIAAATGAKAVPGADEILNNHDIQAVLIATSTDTHVDYLERAAKAGKAIYCEKPIALDYAEAEKAVRTVRATGVPVMLGFNRRFDASHAALRETVVRGGIGKIEIVQLTNRGPKPPPISYVKVSGGQMRDQTIHFFDMLRWLTNDEPIEVYAVGAALVDPAIGEAGDVDTSIVSLRMASGALCQIDSSRRTAYGYDERVEVFGSEGMVESTRQSFRGVSLYQDRQVHRDGMYPGWFERIEQSYYEAIDAFLKAVESKTPPSPSLEDGLKAQLIADKATESMRSGQPVKIPT
jgi:myo-inositol 2-dehydrogenase / D-chiro-inositol 1-dehydrogenase